jgi:hypothetical protein
MNHGDLVLESKVTDSFISVTIGADQKLEDVGKIHVSVPLNSTWQSQVLIHFESALDTDTCEKRETFEVTEKYRADCCVNNPKDVCLFKTEFAPGRIPKNPITVADSTGPVMIDSMEQWLSLPPASPSEPVVIERDIQKIANTFTLDTLQLSATPNTTSHAAIYEDLNMLGPINLIGVNLDVRGNLNMGGATLTLGSEDPNNFVTLTVADIENVARIVCNISTATWTRWRLIQFKRDEARILDDSDPCSELLQNTIVPRPYYGSCEQGTLWVTSDSPIPAAQTPGDEGLSAGTIAGIVIGVVAIAAIVISIAVYGLVHKAPIAQEEASL